MGFQEEICTVKYAVFYAVSCLFKLCCRWQVPQGWEGPLQQQMLPSSAPEVLLPCHQSEGPWDGDVRCGDHSVWASLCCQWGQRRLLDLLLGSDPCKLVFAFAVDTAYGWPMATVCFITLCISRLCRKQLWFMQLICLHWFSIRPSSQVTKQLSNSVGSKKSKHKTDHAVHKTDCSDLTVIEATQRILRSDYLEWLQLQAVQFPKSAAPRHAWIFQSQLQKSKQMNSQQCRKMTILATDWIIKQWCLLYVVMAVKATLHH